MLLNNSFPRETEYVKEKKIPLVIVGGTVEYHGAHCSYGCDTLVAEGLLNLLAKEKEIMIAPSIAYSPSSYAVGGRKSGTVHVPERAFEDYVYYVFKSMLYSGFRNIYVLIHHQFEQEHEMPMTLCYRTAAKRATMEYLEETLGEGWWGSESYSNYYEEMEGLVLCLKMYIEHNPPSAPPKADNNINVDSGIRSLFLIAKCLSMAKSKKLPRLISTI